MEDSNAVDPMPAHYADRGREDGGGEGMMHEMETSRPHRRKALLGALVALVLLVASIVVRSVGHELTPAQAGAPGASATTAPPFTPAPYAVTGRTTLTVPEETRFAQ